MLHFEVKNLGPIAEGAVDLKPLTIFIGKNNCGKSYLATLVYAVLKSLSGGHLDFRVFPLLYRHRTDVFYHSEFSYAGAPVSWPAWESWVKESVNAALSPNGENVELPSQEVLARYKAQVLEGATKITQSYAEGLQHELQRCYASKVVELRRRGSSTGDFAVSLKLQAMGMNFFLDGNTVTVRPDIAIDDHLVKKALLGTVKETGMHRLRGRPPYSPERLSNEILLESASFIYNSLLSDLWVSAYYLPAARSGILQSHKALSSYIVSRSPFAGIVDFEIPKFSGVIVDFLSSLLRLERQKPGSLDKLAKFLEGDVLRGDIKMEVDEHNYPEILYKVANGVFPLHRTSSMVSEVAPIVLFLRYIIKPGDVIIIEEPEAHLHPENQRKLARVLVGLVRAKVKVLITTHSDYLVQQLSNFVALGGVGEPDRAKEGYRVQDYLNAEDVGAYLFKFDEAKDGSVVEEVKVNSSEGIDAEEFGKVAEELYDQSVTLQQKVLRDK
ncbi:MAG: AAA family ATPase [Chloroflexi bacterium]|nr:AAA family ATPase [Chloroflexota bacterium]